MIYLIILENIEDVAMGGIGSGTRYGEKKSKLVTEALPFIDIRLLNRQGYLGTNATTGSFKWRIGDIEMCSIGYRIYSNKMILQYRHRSNEKNWESVEREIMFDQTLCNYGGRRKWFLCGKCGRRVAVLYYLAGNFFCRHCHNLTYASQKETEDERMIRKVQKIRQRLGGSNNIFEPISDKPKGMHQATFDHLQREANNAHNLSWARVEKKFAKYS
jgi:hypothetical protein